MTTSVSTFSCNSTMPAMALRMRGAPSNWKGSVTIPTVSAPCSLAISATVGVAPVPVPPPMPAVRKTRSVSTSFSATFSRSSSTAWRPNSGLAPAPSPWVMLSPMQMHTSADEVSSTWLSVLMAMNSTPCIPESIIRLMALPPAPPTPTTLILALRSLSMILNVMTSTSLALRLEPFSSGL